MPPGAGLPLARLDGAFDRHAHIPSLREEPVRSFDPQREADRFLLDRYGPASVLVNEDMNIVQFRGRTGDFLEPSPGAASLNLMRMSREGLMVALHTAIHDSSERGLAIRREGVQFKSPLGPARVDIQVIPISGPDERRERFCLVLFENLNRDLTSQTETTETAPPDAAAPVASDDEMLAVRQELAATKDYLQSVIESQESFNEELRSANEEVMSANEELQSTNEELETTKEELQSANEELTTLNEELHTRNEALAKANDDLNNLLNSINVAVVILDAELCVRRFTTVAGKLMNLIPTDIGRPFAHINPRVTVPNIADILRDVVDKLATHEFEVHDEDGHWYNLRIRPYKTTENRIDGALLAVMDIDSMKKSAERARHMLEYEAAITEVVGAPLAVLDGQLRVQRVNEAFARAFGVRPEKVVGQFLDSIGDGGLTDRLLRTMMEAPAGPMRVEVLQLDLPDGGGTRSVSARVRRLAGVEGDTVLVAFSV